MESIAQVYGVVYAIRNEQSECIYIGQTTQAVSTRWGQHRSELLSGSHGNSHLQRAWNKYGESAFTFAVLTTAQSREELDAAERFYIDHYQQSGSKLYNFKHGGSAGKLIKPRPPISEETRRKRSETLKRKGIRPSAEAAERARQVSTGRAKTSEEKAKWHASNIDRLQSDEYRQWMSEQKRGKKLGPYCVTDGMRAKWEAQRGHTESEEQTRRRIDALVKNRPVIRFLGPDGNIYETRNVAEFARQYGLAARALLYVAAGKQKQHRGWTRAE